MKKSKREVTPLEAMIKELRELAARIEGADSIDDERHAKKARLELEEVTRRLAEIAAKHDPVLRPLSIFDPTRPSTAGRIVALTMVAQERHPLAAIPDFYGSGVYAIYYRGDFPPYSALSGTEHPLYVGKADPGDAGASSAMEQGTKLSDRLGEHAKNIRKATSTLRIEDFDCRFLIVQTGFQTAAEAYLINFFRPIWNKETKIAYGIGKHGDAAETRANKRSPWDTLHPARDWAAPTEGDQKSFDEIVDQIRSHLAQHPPYTDIRQIIETFMEDMKQLSSDAFLTPDEQVVTLEVTEDPTPVDSSELPKQDGE